MSFLCDINLLDANDADFEAQLDRLTAWDEVSNAAVESVVDQICAQYTSTLGH